MSERSSAAPTLEFDVHLRSGHRGKRTLTDRAQPASGDKQQAIPRITRLLALAHRWSDLIERGQVQDQAEIGRLMGITRARVTQIMNLRLLSPAIQEALLLTPGFTQATEQQIRSALRCPGWQDQQRYVRSTAEEFQ